LDGEGEREVRNAYKILVERPDRKRLLERPRSAWDDNIKIYVKETFSDDIEWIALAHDRDQWRALVNTVTNLRVP
jgi:hypothetical protein